MPRTPRVASANHSTLALNRHKISFVDKTPGRALSFAAVPGGALFGLRFRKWLR